MLYVSPGDTLTNSNDTPAANCHLTGCLLSHNGRLLISPFTAGLAQSQEKHTRVLEVSDSIFCQQPWTGWVKKFHMWLSISVTRLAATSASMLPLLENNRQLEWKMCIFLCSAVSQCCDSQAWAAQRLLLWLWLRWPQTSTPLSVFLVYALVLIFLEILKNVCVLCKEASRGEFLFHWLSSQVFQMTVSHQACVHFSTAAAEETTFTLAGIGVFSSLVQ